MPFALRVWIEFVLIHVLESWVLPFAISLGRVKDIYRRIGERDAIYMTRIHVIKTRWFAIFLHRFWLSDEATPHDHPWNWASLLLTGSYLEHLLGQKPNQRRPGSFVYRQARIFHRVEVPADADVRPVWTLFVRGRFHRFWGFLPEGAVEGWEAAPDQGYHYGVSKFPPMYPTQQRYVDLKRNDF